MIKLQFSRADKLAGLMSFGVNGLRAGDVDRENKAPTIEGLKPREGINRDK
jgi:hypothetical protein